MEEFPDYSDIENDDDSDEPVIQHRDPQLPPAPRYASFCMNNKHLLESSESNMITAFNAILSANSRNLPVYSELISLAEKAPEILNTKDHAITSPSTSRTPSQRSGTSNVSSQGIATTGTTRERHSQRNSGVLDTHDVSLHETPSTSFMNITPAGRRSQPNINGFHRSVLTKLKTLIDKQEEALSILRVLLSATKGVEEHKILEDVLPNPLDSVEELEDLSCSLYEEKSRRKLLQFLEALCANTCANSVRRIMTKLVTNNLWFQFSLKGRKLKRPFQHFALCKVITKASLRAHKGCSEANVKEQIPEFLKYARGKQGGFRFKITCHYHYTLLGPKRQLTKTFL